MDRTISVSIVAKSRLLRETLSRLIGGTRDLKVRVASSSVRDLIGGRRDSDDVLVLASPTAILTDCSTIIEFAKKGQAVGILLIDMESDPQLFFACVRAGVSGYVLKDASAQEVISAVRSVAQGHVVCPRQLCLSLFESIERLETAASSNPIRIGLSLTRRQRELVPLIEKGLTNKEIACHLSISEQTVKNHVHQMLKRTGANGRLAVAELVPSAAIRSC